MCRTPRGDFTPQNEALNARVSHLVYRSHTNSEFSQAEAIAGEFPGWKPQADGYKGTANPIWIRFSLTLFVLGYEERQFRVC